MSDFIMVTGFWYFFGNFAFLTLIAKMRKLLTLTLLISCVQLAFGQFYFNDEGHDTARGKFSEFDIETHFDFVNKSADTAFEWRRYEENVPIGMTTAVCDNNLCYPVEISTAKFNLRTNDSFPMILHFYPDNTCGKGSFKLMVYPLADTNNRIYTQIFAEVWCLSVTSVKANTLDLHPNPANSEIEITFGALDQYDVVIYDIKGQKMLETTSSSLSKRIDIAEFRPGLYVVAVNSKGRTFTQRFIKN